MIAMARRFAMKQPPTPFGEQCIAGALAFLAIALLGLFYSLDAVGGSSLLLGSMGATAVLLFATPHSTLVQPWAVPGGHVISATIGVTSQKLIPPPFAAAAAVGLSIIVMYVTHCLHPPGGATALFAVIGGPSVWDLGYGYILNPVASNAGLMLCMGLALNNLLRPKMVYPAPLPSPSEKHQENPRFEGVTLTDIKEALAASETYLDVTEDDLWHLYQRANLSAHQRFLSNQPVSTVSLGATATLRYGDSIEALWQALDRSENGCVVIVDAFRHVEGIVTHTDVIQYLTHQKTWSSLAAEKLTGRRRKTLHAPVLVAGQIMSTPVMTVPVIASMDQVVTLLARGHFHHVPVVDDRHRLLGVITHAHVWHLLAKKP